MQRWDRCSREWDELRDEVSVTCISFTYDHSMLNARRLPVRSALSEQCTGGPVVRWVTTSEYPLMYVPANFSRPFCVFLYSVRVLKIVWATDGAGFAVGLFSRFFLVTIGPRSSIHTEVHTFSAPSSKWSLHSQHRLLLRTDIHDRPLIGTSCSKLN
jgi:hypothetical protein